MDTGEDLTVMGESTVAVWAAIALLTAALIGAAAGMLTWMETRNAPRSVLVAGGAAGGALALAIAAGVFFQQAA